MNEHAYIADILQTAWGEKQYLALENVLSDQNLEWYEDVFARPLTAKQAVIQQWKNDLASQSNLSVSIDLLDSIDNRGYHRCKAKWLDAENTLHEIEAIFVVKLDEEGKIRQFFPYYSQKG